MVLTLKKLSPRTDIMASMPKHSFNADSVSQDILALTKKTTGDKTELLNRLLALYGRAVLNDIWSERGKLLNPRVSSEPVGRKKVK